MADATRYPYNGSGKDNDVEQLMVVFPAAAATASLTTGLQYIYDYKCTPMCGTVVYLKKTVAVTVVGTAEAAGTQTLTTLLPNMVTLAGTPGTVASGFWGYRVGTAPGTNNVLIYRPGTYKADLKYMIRFEGRN